MLDALLAIFGTLAVLASIAAKFVVKCPEDTSAEEETGPRQRHDNNVVALRPAQGDRDQRRAGTPTKAP